MLRKAQIDPISATWNPPSLLRLPAVRQMSGIERNGSRLELPHVWFHKSSSFNDIFGTAFDVTLVCIENGTKSFKFLYSFFISDFLAKSYTF